MTTFNRQFLTRNIALVVGKPAAKFWCSGGSIPVTTESFDNGRVFTDIPTKELGYCSGWPALPDSAD